MENEQLLKKVIQTVGDNSEAYIICTLADGEVQLTMVGKDSQLTNMIEGIGSTYINNVLDDAADSTVADALDELLDELGFGPDDEEAN